MKSVIVSRPVVGKLLKGMESELYMEVSLSRPAKRANTGADASRSMGNVSQLPSTSSNIQMVEEMEVSVPEEGSISASVQIYEVSSPEQCAEAEMPDSANIQSFSSDSEKLEEAMSDTAKAAMQCKVFSKVNKSAPSVKLKRVIDHAAACVYLQLLWALSV